MKLDSWDAGATSLCAGIMYDFLGYAEKMPC